MTLNFRASVKLGDTVVVTDCRPAWGMSISGRQFREKIELGATRNDY